MASQYVICDRHWRINTLVTPETNPDSLERSIMICISTTPLRGFLFGMPPLSTPLFALALFAIFMLMPFQVAASGTCYPAIDASQPQHLLGYGSLMNTESRQRTTPRAGPSLPVRVTGFQRAWNTRGSSLVATTFLGATMDPEGRFNAALYTLPGEDEIRTTDARESGYCRTLVAAGQIEMLGPNIKPGGQIWIYTVQAERAHAPDQDFPIVQSYVDVFLGGCLTIGAEHGLNDFASECVTTTHDWSAHWVNDRIMPRRPFAHQPLAIKIDGVLGQIIPQFLKARVIE